MWELEGAPAGLIENSRMKQQAGKTNARSRTSVRELEGAPAGFIVNSRMKQQAGKNKRMQSNFGVGVGGSPRRIHCTFTYETASRNKKTNARSRTSVRELEGAPAGFIENSNTKQQIEKQKKTCATELR